MKILLKTIQNVLKFNNIFIFDSLIGVPDRDVVIRLLP